VDKIIAFAFLVIGVCGVLEFNKHFVQPALRRQPAAVRIEPRETGLPARYQTQRKPNPDYAMARSVAVQNRGPRQADIGTGICSGYDPVNRPGDALEVIKLASVQSGTPAGIIYGIWKTESGEVAGDQAGAGGCNVVERYQIREKWIPGNGIRNLQALKQISANSGWDWLTVRGSCGRSTMEVNHRNFGGCIGPMQITPVEWIADPELGDKDPLNFCWAMISTGKRLKRHHDQQVRNDRTDDQAWEWAIRAYLGGPEKDASKPYYRKVVVRWHQWYEWKRSGTLEANLYKEAEPVGRKYRNQEATLAYASR
jgi:hypothetical protein